MAPSLGSKFVGGKLALLSRRLDGLGFSRLRILRSVKAATDTTAAADDVEVFVRLLLPPMHKPLGLIFGKTGGIIGPFTPIPMPPPLLTNDLTDFVCSQILMLVSVDDACPCGCCESNWCWLEFCCCCLRICCVVTSMTLLLGCSMCSCCC